MVESFLYLSVNIFLFRSAMVENKEEDSGGDSDGDNRDPKQEAVDTQKKKKKHPKKKKKKSSREFGRIIIPTLDRSAQV